MAVKTPKAYTVSVPPRSGGAEFHAAIAALEERHDEVWLMAGSMDWVTPSEICGLRAVVEYAAMQSAAVHLDCPTNGDVHSYLERADFYDDLPGNVQLSRPRPSVRRKSHQEKLIELTRIRTRDDVEQLMDRVSKVAQKQISSRSLAKALTTAIGEATENVLDHAESPIGALVAAQRYRSTGLELAVIDLGNGIPTTLARNPRYAQLSHLQALDRALKDGVSSTCEAGRGAGLWELARTIQRAGDSTLRLGSGLGELALSWRAGRCRRSAVIPQHAISGTWISTRIAT